MIFNFFYKDGFLCSYNIITYIYSNTKFFNFQEEPATLSTLNEGELRALLDEAITYKCPKDREGKSNLFKVSLLVILFFVL